MNNLEENIKLLENYLNSMQDEPVGGFGIILLAVQDLLKEYKKLKQNSIPREVAEKKIEELIDRLKYYDMSNPLEAITRNKIEGNIQILQELLEGK